MRPKDSASVKQMEMVGPEATEQALPDGDARFRAVIRAATDAIIGANRDGEIVFFNPAAERMFGRRSEDMSGEPLWRLMPERLRDAHRAGLERYTSTGDARVMGKTLELAGLRKDGTEFPLELSLGTWEATEGRFYIGIIRDITRRKQAEERVEQSLGELTAANRELEAFTGALAHDLKNPLLIVTNFAHQLRETLGDSLGEQEKEDLRRILDAGRRMMHIIDDLRDLAGVNRQEMHLGEVDLSAMGQGIIEDLRVRVPGRDVAFEAVPGIKAHGDKALVKILLINLLQNAWKYTGPRDDARIELGVDDEGDVPTYYVRDNGIGFDEADGERIFQSFERLHTTAEFAGSGLGLATARRIVSRHGGRVWGEGLPGKGAVFRFTLEPSSEDRLGVV